MLGIGFLLLLLALFALVVFGGIHLVTGFLGSTGLLSYRDRPASGGSAPRGNQHPTQPQRGETRRGQFLFIGSQVAALRDLHSTGFWTVKAGSVGTVVSIYDGLTVDRFTVEFGAGTLDVANDEIMPID